MVIKYKFMIKYVEIAVWYKDTNGYASIGGYSKNRETMLELVKYFVTHTPRMHYTQKNKIRFSFAMSLIAFEKTIKDLEKLGFAFEKVKSFGRLTR